MNDGTPHKGDERTGGSSSKRLPLCSKGYVGGTTRACRVILAFSSGEGARSCVDDVVRLELASKAAALEGGRSYGSPAAFFGDPKSRTRAGLAGPAKTSWKRTGDAREPLEQGRGPFQDFSGENIPSSFKIRRLVGLNKVGPLGDSGRLLDLMADAERLGLERRNRSRGRSCKGPGRCMGQRKDIKRAEEDWPSGKRTRRLVQLFEQCAAWRGNITVALCHALFSGTIVIIAIYFCLHHTHDLQPNGSAAITTSNTPVPVAFGRPRTMFPDGLVRSSKSPYNVASDKNAAVVS